MLRLTWPQVRTLYDRWRYRIPRIDVSLAIIARWKPETKITGLPDGCFAEALAATDHLFKDPSRFFDPSGKQTIGSGDG